MKFRKLRLILVVLVALVGISAWFVFGSATSFSEKNRFLYLSSKNSPYQALIQQLEDSDLVKSVSTFEFVAKRFDLANHLEPGKYEIKNGMSVLSIVRMLKNHRQSPVVINFNKFRTKEQLAGYLGKRFENDSLSFIALFTNNDSLIQFGLDSNTVMAGVFPDKYEFNWTSTPVQVLKKFNAQKERFWTEERKAKATQQHLSPIQVYTLASIVEEETNALDEKDTIASVYLNRFRKGDRLQADPTVKFALKNFTLKRIYNDYLLVESPYNTYKYKGLPPGPICTPSKATIDAVLNAPATNYYFFVAKADFSGRHEFSVTFEEHVAKANAFRAAQDEQERIRNSKNK